MHLLLLSNSSWSPTLPPPWPQGHRITAWTGTLAQHGAEVQAARPDVLLVREPGQGQPVIAQIDALCAALPGLALVLVCPDPAPDFLLAAMRAGVREVIPSDEPAVLAGLLARLQGRQGAQARAAAGRCIGLMPAKPGDGASCLAANLAAAVAALPGQRVLLVDLSLPFGDAELYLTGEPVTHDLAEVALEIERLDGALLDGLTQHLPGGLHFIGAPPHLESYLQLGPEPVLRLVRVALRHYDHVFLDLGLDAIGLAALELLDRLVLVGSMSLPSIKGASQRVALWELLGLPAERLELVMRVIPGAGGLKRAEVEAAVGRPLARLLPHDAEAVAASLAGGRPAVEIEPRSHLSRALRQWAGELTGQGVLRAPKEKTLWHRLGIR